MPHVGYATATRWGSRRVGVVGGGGTTLRGNAGRVTRTPHHPPPPASRGGFPPFLFFVLPRSFFPRPPHRGRRSVERARARGALRSQAIPCARTAQLRGGRAAWGGGVGWPARPAPTVRKPCHSNGAGLDEALSVRHSLGANSLLECSIGPVHPSRPEPQRPPIPAVRSDGGPVSHRGNTETTI